MVKEKFIAVWAFFLVFPFSRAQNPDLEWVKSVEASFGFGQRSMALDAWGNIYAIGYFSGKVDFDPGQDTLYLSSQGETDIFIQKLDQQGTLLWVKSIGSAYKDYGFSIAIDDSDNVYATGFFEGMIDFDPGDGRYELVSTGLSDVFILKLDLDGHFIWARHMGGSNNEMAYAIATDSIGNVYTTGWFADAADFDPGPEISNLYSLGLADVFIQKLDFNGDFLWARSFGGDSSDESFSIDIDTEGNVYTTGWFYGVVDFDPGSGTNLLSSAGDADIFIQKIDKFGNFIWAKAIGGTSYDYGAAIAVDAGGNVYHTGRFSDVVNFGSLAENDILTSVGATDVFVRKLDNAGNLLWARSMGGSSNDFGNSIFIDKQANVFTTGYFKHTVDFDTGPNTSNITSTGIWDAFIQKLSTSGDFIWAKSFGGIYTDKAYSISVDDVGNIYTAGYFEGPADFDPGVNSSILNDAFGSFIQKLKETNLTDIKIIHENDTIILYPNPISDYLHIDLDKSYNQLSLRLVNTAGQVIHFAKYDHLASVSVDLSNLPAGVYFGGITLPEKTISIKFVKE